jgi:hypothetical protein
MPSIWLINVVARCTLRLKTSKLNAVMGMGRGLTKNSERISSSKRSRRQSMPVSIFPVCALPLLAPPPRC